MLVAAAPGKTFLHNLPTKLCNRGKTNGGKPERLPGVSDADYQKMLEGSSDRSSRTL